MSEKIIGVNIWELIFQVDTLSSLFCVYLFLCQNLNTGACAHAQYHLYTHSSAPALVTLEPMTGQRDPLGAVREVRQHHREPAD